jgi:hypothetical protein
MAGFTPERRSGARQSAWSGAERRRDAGGRTIADLLDPAAEEAYWRENSETQPYYEPGYAYDDYHPAYRTGWEGRARFEGRSFEEVEPELEAQYDRCRGSSRLDWEKCRHAARAAWDRFDATDPFERSQ